MEERGYRKSCFKSIELLNRFKIIATFENKSLLVCCGTIFALAFISFFLFRLLNVGSFTFLIRSWNDNKLPSDDLLVIKVSIYLFNIVYVSRISSETSIAMSVDIDKSVSSLNGSTRLFFQYRDHSFNVFFISSYPLIK